MKKIQSWVDLWAIRYPGMRAVFVGQVRAMLSEVLDEVDKAATRVAYRDGTTHPAHRTAVQMVREEIEGLK